VRADGRQARHIADLGVVLPGLEAEADDVLLELLRDLYCSHHDTVRVVFLKDLYELLEKVADRCRDAGNVINHIVLKNS
jgi:uncharacterized protein Yka (UPF0111/DUF47 family)